MSEANKKLFHKKELSGLRYLESDIKNELTIDETFFI